MSGGTNYGEKVVFRGGSLFNGGLAIKMANGAGGLFFTNVSIDYNEQVIQCAGGLVHMQGCHIEFSNSVDVVPFYADGESSVTLSGGWVQTSGGTWTEDYVVESNENANITFDHVRFINLLSLVGFDTGTGRVNVKNPYINPVAKVTRERNHSMTSDPSFDAGELSKFDISIYRDPQVIINKYEASNIKLSISAINPRTGVNSLRVEKEGGAGSSASFIIMVPASVGQLFIANMYSSNKGGRDGQVYITDHFAKLNGYNEYGIPTLDVGPVLNSFTVDSQTYTRSRSVFNGGSDRVCPEWADKYVINVNMVDFVGGDSNPDGGWESMYFDDINIWKWG